MPRIAVIPGDGVGKEVVAEGVKLLAAIDRESNLGLSLAEFDYGADRFLRDGVTLPKEQIADFRDNYQAILFGAVGDPRVPDGRHAREILLALRFELDLYVNLRPVRLLTDRLTPLKGKARKDIDFLVFRENTEGIYVDVGGVFKRNTPDEIAINEDINTRKGVERICRAALEHARKNNVRTVWMSDKANAMRYAHDIWQRTWKELAKEYAELELRHMYVDALAMQLVMKPEMFRIIVTSNLFGDILSDIGAGITGGLGFAASANLNPGKIGLFEPVHGSAPDIAGRGIANPLATLLSCALLLSHLGFERERAAVERAVEDAVGDGFLTKDAGGEKKTKDVGDFVVDRVLRILHT